MSSAELQRLEQLSHAGRRTQWLAGRWLSRRLIGNVVAESNAEPVSLHEIEVHSHDETGRSSRPEIRIRGVRQPWGLSISHTDQWAAVALSTETGSRVGIDIVESQSARLSGLSFWLTPGEQELLATSANTNAMPTVTLALLWSIKEATYKAVTGGEPFSPAMWDVCYFDDGLFQCRSVDDPAASPSITIMHQQDAVVALAVVSDSETQAPNSAVSATKIPAG